MANENEQQNTSAQTTNNQSGNRAQSTSQQQTGQVSLEDKLIEMRQEWTKKVETLNADMKNPATLDHLLNVVYTERQNAVDLYYATKNTFDKQLRGYKQQYAAIYNSFKMGANGIRYTNETAIQTQCEAQLTDLREIIEQLKNFIDFMWETIKSIDGLQYAISSKIKIYEILNGLKF